MTPGSQILWSTAISNVLNGRYEKPSEDLKKLLLGRYGPFPFYDPYEWILQKVLESGRTDAKSWQQILADEAGVQELADEDLNARRIQLSSQIKRPATDEELCIYAQFPRDALEFIKFEERFGQTWLLPPDVWFHEGGFSDGTRITIADETGKIHHVDLISTRRSADSVQSSFPVDYRFETYTTQVSKNRAN